MKSLSTSISATNGAFSALLDVRSLQPSSILVKLSENLGLLDTVAVYGTLDSTAVSTSPNLVLLGSVAGNQGDPGAALSVSEWPYLIFQRLTGNGSTAGTVIVSGSANSGTPVAPTLVALPSTVGAFSTGLNLQNFGAGFSVRVALDKSSTASDSFTVYGTNDPAFVGTAGGQVLATISGGGGANQVTNSARVTNFQYVYVARVSGSTAGNLLAWGADDAGSGQGPVEIGSLAVNNTAVNGNFGTPPLTAPQSVDVYSSFVLTQTTAGIVATLPAPTVTTAGKIVFVSLATASTQNITLYGATLSPGFGMSFQWDGSEWTPVGVGNAATLSGNAPGRAITVGTTDGSAATFGALTGAATLLGTTSVTITSSGIITSTGGDTSTPTILGAGGAYNVLATDRQIIYTGTGGRTINLPAPNSSGASGRLLTFINASVTGGSANALTITPTTGVSIGAGLASAAVLLEAGDAWITIQDNGTGWSIVDRSYNNVTSLKTGTAYVIAETDDYVPCDPSGGVVTVTLPATPVIGEKHTVPDATGHAGTNNITIARNGQNINGAAANSTITVNFNQKMFVFLGGTTGWMESSLVP